MSAASADELSEVEDSIRNLLYESSGEKKSEGVLMVPIVLRSILYFAEKMISFLIYIPAILFLDVLEFSLQIGKLNE